MKLYNELANWWHLLSAPEEYEEEAWIYTEIIFKYNKQTRTCLELGSGGGNNAHFLKKHFKMLLTDVSEAMLKVNKQLNPDCEHVQGDMRTLRLAQKFDLVFIHDAICYITNQEDLIQVFQTAKHHLNPGGLVFIMPDDFEDTFKPGENCGGHDNGERGLRYLEWTYDLDPTDSKIAVQYAYILRDKDGKVFHEHDESECGLFSKASWKSGLEQVGFEVHFEKVEFSDQPEQSFYGIIGVKK